MSAYRTTPESEEQARFEAIRLARPWIERLEPHCSSFKIWRLRISLRWHLRKHAVPAEQARRAVEIFNEATCIARRGRRVKVATEPDEIEEYEKQQAYERDRWSCY